MSLSHTLLPTEHAKKIRFEAELSVPPVQQFSLPPDMMYVGGDSHANYLVRIWRYITVGVIAVSDSDYLELVRILHNLIQLNPSVEILSFSFNEYKDITVGDFNQLLLNCKIMSRYMSGINEYVSMLEEVSKHLKDADDNEKLGESINEDGFSVVIDKLRYLIIVRIAALKALVCEDLDIYREVLTRIKILNSESEEWDIGDKDGDRVGCDIHNWLLTKYLIEKRVNLGKFSDSNHGRVVLYALKHVKRLESLSGHDFLMPLRDEECLGLPVGRFVASFLNMLRFVCMGKFKYNEMMDLFNTYIFPNANIIKVVRDKDNAKITFITHAPSKRNDQLQHQEFLDLLDFFKIEYPNMNDHKSICAAADKINVEYRKWFGNPDNKDEVFKLCNQRDHVLHRIVWNRVDDDDLDEMIEKINNDEILIPDDQEEVSGHDGGMKEIPSPLRPRQHCIDDDGGKGGVDRGGISMMLLRLSSTPKPTTLVAKQESIDALKESVERLSPEKSLARKRRKAESYGYSGSPITLFTSPKKLLDRTPLPTLSFELNLDDEGDVVALSSAHHGHAKAGQ